MARAFRPEGHYVLAHLRGGRGGRLLGKVVSVDGELLVLDSDERRPGADSVPAASAYLEPRSDNLADVLRDLWPQFADTIIDHLKHLAAERLSGRERLRFVRGWIRWLRELATEVVQGIPVEVGAAPVLSPGTWRPDVTSLARPALVFAYGGTRTHERNQVGLDLHGPYGWERFPRRKPNIAVICQASKQSAAFSAVAYAPGTTRGKRNVVHATALVLDFDHLTTEAAESVRGRLERRGWAWLAYSSFSHQADGEDDCCFRVLVLLSRPVLPEEYDSVWVAANAALGNLADRNARDISRVWFVAACPPERAAVAWLEHRDGRPLDVDGAVAADRQGRQRQRRTDRGVGDAGPPIPGDRNSALLSLAGAMRRRGADLETILDALRQTNRTRCQPPLEAAEVARIAESAVRYQPTSVLLAANRTDLGNAERFAAFAGDRFRYVHTWGSWLYFDGRRWCRDTDGGVTRWCRDTLRAVAAEAGTLAEPEARDELVKHALDSESAARISAMTGLAQALLPVAPDELDRDPDLFNVANGTLDLRIGQLRPHDRGDRLTRLAPVTFDPAATCPRWDAFLLRCMGGDEALVRFIQRAVGHALTGHTTEQVLLLLYGTGANGKSTFLETLRALLGDYYATQADFTTFLKREGEGVRNDLAGLVGTRFVSAVEAEAGVPLAEALVKQVTGGDIITARFLFREFFEFRPTFKLWLAANHKPTVRGSDHGIWRRIRLVPFTVTIPEPERDPQLTQKLAAELPGILAWAVRGCLDWRANGLGAPAALMAATASYRDEMDAFGGARRRVGHCEGAVRGVPGLVRGQRRAAPLAEGAGHGASGAGFAAVRTKKARGWGGAAPPRSARAGGYG